MPRRKRRNIGDDGDDSSAESDDDGFNFRGDAQEERALFENPYQYKRRRRSGRTGGFDESDEESDHERDSKNKRNDWTKAPSFISAASGPLPESTDTDENSGEVGGPSVNGAEGEDREEDQDEDGEDDEDDNEDEVGEVDGDDHSNGDYDSVSENSDSGSVSGSSRLPSQMVQEDEEQEKRSGIGSKGGIGSTSSVNHHSSAPYPSPSAFPSSFGGARAQRSFVRDAGNAAGKTPPVPLAPAELAHFGKLQGTFGARMLSKMGWQTGAGLGVTGEGIVTPIDQKQRPGKIGIAYRGFKEKTEQSKAEARRRGEVVSDDERRQGKKLGVGAAGPRSDAWKKPKKVKTKVVYKTYEQIVAEAGQESSLPGIGIIIDATGAIPREVSSLAEISRSSWTPSTDPTRIPEVRHNLRLITDACKTNLDQLAREAKSFEERKKWIADEDSRLRKKIADEADLISRLQQVNLIATELSNHSKELASIYEASLDSFTPYIRKLLDQFSPEFDKYHLDEIVVAAISPVVRRLISQWRPLEEPSAFTSTFREWRQALKLTTSEKKPPLSDVNVYGTESIISSPIQLEKPMTPFESMLWNVWLPKVRSSINNDWSPKDPHPAVRLYESWFNYLPQFIRDNFLDQLILPKVHKAVEDWNHKRDAVSLQTIVFPWLPHVGLRFDGVVGDARRKVASELKAWVVGDAIPADLIAWKEVFKSEEWDTMMLKHVVPKLALTLRDEFLVNRPNQDMEPITRVLEWSTIIRPSVISRLLETEFFTKWLDILHVWLIQPGVNFDEVTRWYRFWKDAFPESIQNLSGVSRNFTRGLQLMNKAYELGVNAPTHLPRPVHDREPSSLHPNRDATKVALARPHEITFRSVVEDFAAANNLLFMPIGRVEELSRMPLFRVSLTADGKGGLLVYILGDAVWAQSDDGGDFRAISLDDMVARASA